jgi:2',3'-cyclic-nucleotide 2'-phosphodiesterase (5'-nucleotidase family)
MKRFHNIFFAVFCASFLFLSCKTVYQPQSVSYKDYSLHQGSSTDNKLAKLLQPYKDSVNKNMNNVVAVAGAELAKSQPEGALGNVLADAMLVKARASYKCNVDIAVINYEGIRLNSIPAGNITKGKIFELSPFDNILVLIKINGKLLQEFLNHISNKGGWPVSGVQWQIKNKIAINVIINGKPIDITAMYTIALTDYIANGGDDCIMLKSIPQINNGYLFRDAIMEYFADINKQGKEIVAQIENRVSNAE